MTWAAVQTRGAGPLDFRLVIEGYPTIFCTDGLTAGAQSDGRERVHGLMAGGIRWSERQHFVEPVGKITGFRVDIADHLGKATGAFAATASFIAWMDQDEMLRLSNNLDLTTVSGLSVGDHLHIGTEAVKIASISGRNIIVDRGEWDTQAVAHSRQFGVTAAEVEVTDVPILATGRRVWVYAHGASELGTSDSGTLVYKGLVGQEPKFDGTKWSLLIDPLTKILDQEIGVDRDGISLRGIHYGADLRVVLKEYSGSSRGTVADESRVILSGYYETQADFLATLQGYIDTATSGWTNTYTATEETTGQWTIVVDVDSGTPVFSDVFITSQVDGVTSFEMQDMSGFRVTSVSASDRIKPVWATPVTAAEAAPDGEGETTLKDITLDVRTVPRATYPTGARAIATSPFFVDMAEFGDTPGSGDNRAIYLYGIEGATVGDTLSINGAAFEIATVNTSTGKITVASAPAEPIAGNWCGLLQPALGLTADVGGMTDFGAFIEQIVDESLDRAASEGLPFFRTDDFDEASIQAAVDDAKADLPPLQARSYAFHEAKTLRDVMAQELLAHGAYFYLTSDWKIGARRIRSILNVAHDLTDLDDRTVSEGFGTVSLVPDVVNAVEIKTGYTIDPEDGSGEHKGRTYKPREVRSQTRMRQRRVLSIAPEVVVSARVTAEDAQRMAMPYMSLLGHRYEIYALNVGLPFYDVLVGESVRFSAPQLASDGRRGVTNAVGLVVGREWNPSSGSGRLTLLRVLENVAGYAPSALVSGWTLDSGTKYDLTTTNRYAASGNDASTFEDGFEVALVEWSASGRKYRGTVADVSGTTISVEFQTALPSFSGRWTLSFEHHQACTDAQRAYAFVADWFYRLSNTDSARVTGP